MNRRNTPDYYQQIQQMQEPYFEPVIYSSGPVSPRVYSNVPSSSSPMTFGVRPQPIDNTPKYAPRVVQKQYQGAAPVPQIPQAWPVPQVSSIRDINDRPNPQYYNPPQAINMFDQSQIDPKTTDISGVTAYNQFFPQKRQNDNKMYKSIYREVMGAAKKSPRAAFAPEQNSAFDSYRQVWNKYQDRNDREYQMELKAKNEEIHQRMVQAEQRRQANLVNKKTEAQWQKEYQMKQQCSFVPKISKKSASRSPVMRDPSHFIQSEKQFLEKKQNWLQEQWRRQDQKHQKMLKTKFMSKNSQQIWENSSKRSGSALRSQESDGEFGGFHSDAGKRERGISIQSNTSGKSQRIESFLNRNYYQYPENKNYEMRKVLKKHPSVAASDSSSNTGAKSDRRKKTNIHEQLYQDSKKSPNRIQTAYPVLPIKNDYQKLTQKFIQEFETVFCHQIDQGPQLYLLDIMEDLKFLNHDLIDKNYEKIDQMLQQFGITLIIELENEVHQEQVRKNLQTFSLAIYNMNARVQAHELPEQILKAHLNMINEKITDREKVLIDQLTCIKSLVNRKTFSLSDRQILQIHLKFKAFSNCRKDTIFDEKKKQKMAKVLEEENQKYRFQPNIKSLEVRNQQMKHYKNSPRATKMQNNRVPLHQETAESSADLREISPEMKVRRAKGERRKKVVNPPLQAFLNSERPKPDFLDKYQVPKYNPKYLKNQLPTVEEPICVLKIELDGHHLEEIKVFENDDPAIIVHQFGEKFNLSDNAKRRLLEQIHEQIQMDEDA